MSKKMIYANGGNFHLGDFGMGAADLVFGTTLGAFTGKDASSLFGYDYKTAGGEKFNKVSNQISNVSGALAPAVAGVGVGALAGPQAGMMAANGLNAVQGGLNNATGGPETNIGFDANQVTQPIYGMTNTFSPMMGGNPVMNPTTFEMGGKMKYAMGGELTHIEGPSHEMGGVELTPNAEAEGGETKAQDFIYSDTLKVGKAIATEFKLPYKKGETYADMSKRIEKKFNKVERDNDTFKTEALNQQLDKIATAQETHKQRKMEKLMGEMESLNPGIFGPATQVDHGVNFRMGGKMKYFDGGYFRTSGPSFQQGKGTFQTGYNFNDVSTWNPQTITAGGGNATPDAAPAGGGFSMNSALPYLQYAPAVASAGQLAYTMMNKPTPINEADYRIDNPFSPNRLNLDMTQARTDVGNVFDSARNASIENSGGSRSAIMGQNLQLGAEEANTLARINENKANMEAQAWLQEQARTQQGEFGVSSQNQRSDMWTKDVNDADRAMYEYYLHQGIGQVGSDIGQVATNELNRQTAEDMSGYKYVNGRWVKTTPEGN